MKSLLGTGSSSTLALFIPESPIGHRNRFQEEPVGRPHALIVQVSIIRPDNRGGRSAPHAAEGVIKNERRGRSCQHLLTLCDQFVVRHWFHESVRLYSFRLNQHSL